MTATSSAASRRAAARSDWPVRAYRLRQQPSENLADSTSASERLAMMWELARQAWSLTGRELPDYPREEAPGRVIRSR